MTSKSGSVVSSQYNLIGIAMPKDRFKPLGFLNMTPETQVPAAE